jgi:hypothetical protein
LRLAPEKTATAHLSNFAALLRYGNVRYRHKADMAITLHDGVFGGKADTAIRELLQC